MAAFLPSRLIIFGILAGALTVGCRGPDEDGDGYHAKGEGAAVDCDDGNADIHPGAEEYCDGIDNDCDGLIDEDDAVDPATWYGDGDGDGFGLDSATEEACADANGDGPNGYVSVGGDCDDDDASINPDTLWYEDADGDGFGDEDSSQASCTQPDGYVADDTDCDDTEAEINPDEEELCDDVDHDCTGHNGMYDEDGDGVAECEGDCDDILDDDPKEGPYADEIYPDADEYCDGADNDCDDEIDEDDAVDAPTWYLDYDEDGYGGESYSWVQCDQPDGTVDNADDCDDLEATTYPGADEYCNDVDDDCDKDVDETGAVDAPTWYQDLDGDGYGTKKKTVTDECEMPSGYAETADDCDDGDFDTNPGALEYCDGHDDNCDGNVDENTAVDVLTWYLDDDGDAYGQAAFVSFSCDEPSGYTAASGDCDDTDSTINPDAEEVCDGTDNDCDGVADEDDATDADVWYADTDGDDYGDPDNTQNACNQPTGYVVDDTDCDDTDASVSPDADEICNDGIDNNCSGDFDACTMDVADVGTMWLGSASSEQAGRYLTTIGDVNADGIDDIMIGARSAYSTQGANYIYFGDSDIDALGEITLGDGTADAIVVGSTAAYYAAVSGAGGSDLDGDGIADFAVGSAGPNSEKGEAWVFFVDPSGEIYTDDADASYGGDNSYDRVGAPNGLAMPGDIDDDGANDLLLAAYTDDVGPSNSGSVYIAYGPITTGTDTTVGALDDVVYGENSSDYFGKLVTGIGDADGDGVEDFAASASQYDSNRGAVYVFTTTVSGTISAADADLIITGEDISDYLGVGVDTCGDTDGDGYAELLLGASSDDTGATDAGAVYIVPANATSGVVDTVLSAKLYGTESSGKFGQSVAGTDDYYGDYSYQPAILVGAANEGVSSNGAVHLFLGTFSGSVDSSQSEAVLSGTNSGDAVGTTVEFSGDIDGSGAKAIMTSTYYADQGGTDAGAGYLLFDLDE